MPGTPTLRGLQAFFADAKKRPLHGEHSDRKAGATTLSPNPSPMNGRGEQHAVRNGTPPNSPLSRLRERVRGEGKKVTPTDND
uniref:Uncharacterized protein n=1 Tax=Ectopseudomonas oleovorans TaxID=301 RepID=A0A653B6L6_ECTOL